VGVLDAVRGHVAAPGTLAWQLSAVPRQVLGVPTSDRATVPFLAAVVGTAVVGLVEWPVALLVGGGYLLSRSLVRPAAAPARPAAAAAAAAEGPREPAPGPPPAAQPAADVLDAPDVLGTPNVLREDPLVPEDVSVSQDVSVSPESVEPVDSAVEVLRVVGPQGAGAEHQAPATLEVSADGRSLGTGASRASADPEPRESEPASASAAGANGQAASGATPGTGAGPEAQEPWAGYDYLTVPQVVARLDDSDVDLDAVGDYETAHRDRKMVLAAITTRQSGPRAS